MKRFSTLTRVGQARRLRAVALTALTAYALDVQRIRLVHNETNCTFRVDTTDGCAYALRVNRPHVFSPANIRSEIAWQEAVGRDTDIAVPAAVQTRTGDVLVTVEAPGVPEPRHCAIFAWLRGRPLAKQPTPANAEQWGRLAALLHTHGENWKPPASFSVRTLDRIFPFGDPDRLNSPRGHALVPAATRRLVDRMRVAVETELARLYARPGSPGLVHADLHGWNIKVDRGKLQLFDFEDLCYAYPIQDIATSLFYIVPRPSFSELRAAFRSGYEALRPWPEEYPGQLELLMVHRAIDLLNFALSWDDREGMEFVREAIDGLETHDRQMFEIWQAAASRTAIRR